MKKDKQKRFIIVFIIVLIFAVAQILIDVFIGKDYDYENNSKMFTCIDDLEFLDEYVIDEDIGLDSNVRKYKDNIVESKTVTIKYNKRKINIFAYVFKDAEACIQYANKVTGNDYGYWYSQGEDSSYYYNHSSILNILQSEKLLIFSKEKVYVIRAKIPESEFNQFVEYFMGQLPLDLDLGFFEE